MGYRVCPLTNPSQWRGDTLMHTTAQFPRCLRRLAVDTSILAPSGLKLNHRIWKSCVRHRTHTNSYRYQYITRHNRDVLLLGRRLIYHYFSFLCHMPCSLFYEIFVCIHNFNEIKQSLTYLLSVTCFRFLPILYVHVFMYFCVKNIGELRKWWKLS